MTRRVSANFAPSPAPVAQWIEQRFPKPQVAGSSPAGGAAAVREIVHVLRRSCPMSWWRDGWQPPLIA